MSENAWVKAKNADRCGSCGLAVRVLGEERTCTECGVKLCLGCNDDGVHRDCASGPPPHPMATLFDDIRNSFDKDNAPFYNAIYRVESWAEGIETIVQAQKHMLDAFRKVHDCKKNGHVWEEDVDSCGGRCCACKADYEELHP